jgi:hypothetical protein
MSSLTRTTLEALLEERSLPVQGLVSPRHGPLPTGIFPIDTALAGGVPRGQLSEIHGSASSGRTGLVQALVARTTQEGSLVAWLDPGDHLDPAMVSAAGVDLPRLFWLRGGGRDQRSIEKSLSALGVLLGSGIFHLVVLDLAGLPAAALRWPNATWIRLGRMIEGTATAMVLLADGHVACGPRGASLALDRAGPCWSGAGPARLFRGFEAQVRVGRHAAQPARFSLQATH